MINKKRLVAVIAALAAVVAAVFASAAIRGFFLDDEIKDIKFKTGIGYSTESYGSEILLVNNEGVRAMSRAGKEEWSIAFASTSPSVRVRNKYIMLADVNGKNLALYRGDKLITKIKTEKEIIAASMNKNGYIAAATDELGYKGMVAVFDRSGKEIYRWHSGTGYIGGIDLSPRGRLAVLQIMTDKDKVYTKVLEMDIRNNKEAKTLTEIDGIALEARYRDNSSLTVVADSAVFNLKSGGKVKGKIDFEGRTPSGYNIQNENNMVFAFENRLNNTILEMYSSGGTLKGSFDSGDGIKAFDVSGEAVIAAKLHEIVTVSSAGKLKKTVQTHYDVKNMKIFPSRDKALVIGGSNAEIIKIR